MSQSRVMPSVPAVSSIRPSGLNFCSHTLIDVEPIWTTRSDFKSQMETAKFSE